MFHVKRPIRLIELFNFLKSINYPLAKNKCTQFNSYIDLLKKWSQRYHLISKNDLGHIVEKHILPSLLFYHHMDKRYGAAVLDLGSGAGFPGIVIKIMQPDLKIVLIDSVKKKYLFLKEASHLLNIDCEIIYQRVEQYQNIGDKKFDFIVSRAVAPLNILWKWSLPILKHNGVIYAMKGGNCDNELSDLNNDKIKIDILYPPESWIQFSKFLKEKYLVKLSLLRD